MSGCCSDGGKLINEGRYGFVWSSSEINSINARHFIFNEDEGKLYWFDRNCALAVRPVLK